MKKLPVLSLLFAWSSSAGPLYANLARTFILERRNDVCKSPTHCSVGTVFTASASGVLGDVLVPVANDLNHILSFGLYSDASGRPGALLESWSNISVPARAGSLATLDSVAHPLLTSGDVYWFTATSGSESHGHDGMQWNVSDELTSVGVLQCDFGTWAEDFVRNPPAAIELAATELDTAGAPERAALALAG